MTYVNGSRETITQLALVGDNSVHLIESKALGMSKTPTPQGLAQNWLAEGIIKSLAKG